MHSALFFSKYCLFLVERLRLYFDNALANCGVRPIPEVTKAGYWLFCNLINEINHASEAIGKDGKLQIFILIGLRLVIFGLCNAYQFFSF